MDETKIEDLKFDISNLVEKPIGTGENFSFDVQFALEEDGETTDLTGKAEIMKIDDGFNAIIKDTEFITELFCERCLEKMDQKIIIDHAERQFLWDTPKKIEDPHDVYVVDKKGLKIDLSEMIRQEIILHFPANAVCYEGCQGICPNCGKDRNKEQCDCKPKEPEGYKPLSALKDLIKPEKHGKASSTKKEDR